MTASFLWEIHESKCKRFFKKSNVHLEGEATKDFLECKNGLGCLYDLIKREIFETLV